MKAINTMKVLFLQLLSCVVAFSQDLDTFETSYVNEQKQAPIVKATRLYDAFQANAIQADEFYKDKLIILLGKKNEIDVERYGDYKGVPYIDFEAGDFIEKVRAYFVSAVDDESQMQQLKSGRVGYNSAIWCRVVDRTLFDNVVVEAYAFINENDFNNLKAERTQESNQAFLNSARAVRTIEVRKALPVTGN